ncbi:MAG: VPLPA-CTERM sorting domain-containing protein [Pseudooceanicola sp.]
MGIKSISMAIAASTIFSLPAHATIIDGMITGGSAFGIGSFTILDETVPFTVGNNNFQTKNLYGFNENQNVNVTSEIQVDVGTNPQVGEIVASHYIFFDPANSTSVLGWVDFDSEIYGIATSRGNLLASDNLQSNAVTYLNPGLRGLESVDSAWIDAGNANRLRVDFTASTPGDYIRVFTKYSPTAAVPLPAAAPLLIGAIGALGFARRRRKS